MNVEATPTSELQLLEMVADVIASLRKNIRLLALATGLAFVAGVVTALLLPSSYRADTELMPPPTQRKGGLLGAMASGSGDISSLFGGSSSSSVPLMETMLRSRSMAFHVIQKHRLDTVWLPDGAWKKARWENLLVAWNANFSYEITEYDGIKLYFLDKDSVRATRVVTTATEFLDSSYQVYQRGIARQNEAFLQKQLSERQSLLAKAEDSLLAFQIANKAFLPSAQIDAQAKKAALDQVELEKLNIMIELEKKTDGEGARYQELEFLRSAKERNVAAAFDTIGFTRGTKGSNPNLIALTRLNLRFQRLLRQIEIHGKVFAFLIQQKEQYSLDANKNIPALTVIDAPKVPQKRAKPPRSTVVLAFTLFGFLGTWGGITLWPSVRRLNAMVSKRVSSQAA